MNEHKTKPVDLQTLRCVLCNVTFNITQKHSCDKAMTAQAPQELKACPWCGDAADIQSQFGRVFWLQCTNLSCGRTDGIEYESEKSAARAWNRRAAAQPEPNAGTKRRQGHSALHGKPTNENGGIELSTVDPHPSSSPAPDARELLQVALEYVAAHHRHHHVISEFPVVLEPCERCELTKAIRAFLSAPQPAATQVGFVAVPIEPTGEMIDAAARIAGWYPRRVREVRAMWYAMLAAAPTPERGQR